LNGGGFANLSFEEASTGRRIAYDLCPANYCLNRLMRTRGAEYDKDGATARSGQVIGGLLDALNDLEYYRRPAPKSLSQEWVDASVMPLVDRYSAESLEDKMATLTEHAASRIAEPLSSGAQVLVTGGGAYNTYLMERLASYGSFTLVFPSREVIDFKEALIFAFLGLLRVKGLPNCLQSVTGASRDVSSGTIYGLSTL
jgi:anhydro-N-acetylmuramic acid kinase